MEQDPVMRIARAFARALDADDFAAAARLLAPDCVYEVGGERHVGARAIVDSYRRASEWARASFDEVSYESRVEPATGGLATIHFVDLLRQGDRRHRHECRQELAVGRDERIAHIVHHDLPGETEALRAFFRLCGIAP